MNRKASAPAFTNPADHGEGRGAQERGAGARGASGTVAACRDQLRKTVPDSAGRVLPGRPDNPALFRWAGTLTPEDNLTHLRRTFELESEMDPLFVDFQYDPLIVGDQEELRRQRAAALSRCYPDPDFAPPAEELERRMKGRGKNLLTLTITDSRGFRGTAHRYPDGSAFILGQAPVSPGFIPGPIPAGPLTFTISVHLVCSPVCSWELSVHAVRGGAA